MPPMPEPYQPPAPVAVAEQPAYQPYVPYVPPQPMPAPPLTKTKDDGIRREATVVGVLLLVVALVAGVQRFRGGGDDEEAAAPAPRKVQTSVAPTLADMNAPATIGGAPRLVTVHTKALARELRTILPNKGRHSEIEIYGQQHAEYAILAGDLISGGGQRVLDYLIKGSRSRYGTPRAYPGGLVCAPYTAPSGLRASVCAWGSKTSDGLVLGYDHPRAATLAPIALKAKRDFQRGY